MDYWLRVAFIAAIGAAAFFALKRIDPLEGKDYFGLSPKTKRTTIVGLAALVTLLLVFKTNEPSTLEECHAEAAKMPTNEGVRLAASSCLRRFRSRPASSG